MANSNPKRRFISILKELADQVPDSEKATITTYSTRVHKSTDPKDFIRLYEHCLLIFSKYPKFLQRNDTFVDLFAECNQKVSALMQGFLIEEIQKTLKQQSQLPAKKALKESDAPTGMKSKPGKL